MSTKPGESGPYHCQCEDKAKHDGAKPRKRDLGAHLRAAGFDMTEYDRSEGAYRVRCSQCEALVINGIAVHEHGCPNRC